MTIANAQINQAALDTTLIHHSYNDYAKKFGLNYNELIVLYSLFVHGVCTQKQIGAVREVPKQTVHNICKHWLSDGLIEFVEASDYQSDKREKYLALTEAGKILALKVVEPLLALEHQVVAAFGAEKMAAFLMYFDEIETLIGEKIGGKAKQVEG